MSPSGEERDFDSLPCRTETEVRHCSRISSTVQRKQSQFNQRPSRLEQRRKRQFERQPQRIFRRPFRRCGSAPMVSIAHRLSHARFSPMENSLFDEDSLNSRSPASLVEHSNDQKRKHSDMSSIPIRRPNGSTPKICPHLFHLAFFVLICSTSAPNGPLVPSAESGE